MGIAEYFPVRFWRGTSSLTFPIIYAMSWQFGIHITIIALVLVTLIIHLHRRSPIQRMLFNSTQHALSLLLAEWFSNKCVSLLINKMDMSVLYENLISLLLFCVFFVFSTTAFTIC